MDAFFNEALDLAKWQLHSERTHTHYFPHGKSIEPLKGLSPNGQSKVTRGISRKIFIQDLLAKLVM